MPVHSSAGFNGAAWTLEPLLTNDALKKTCGSVIFFSFFFLLVITLPYYKILLLLLFLFAFLPLRGLLRKDFQGSLPTKAYRKRMGRKLCPHSSALHAHFFHLHLPPCSFPLCLLLLLLLLLLSLFLVVWTHRLKSLSGGQGGRKDFLNLCLR
jgi:hypothetical protein